MPAPENPKSEIQNPKSRHAFSLPELLVTIAVIGILAGIAIQSYQGINSAAHESAARDNLGLLNRAVLHYGQTSADITVSPTSGSADELAILATLKTRDPEIPGSPYVALNFRDTVSASSDDYRIQWNGRAFELLMPGTAGTGLRPGE